MCGINDLQDRKFPQKNGLFRQSVTRDKQCEPTYSHAPHTLVSDGNRSASHKNEMRLKRTKTKFINFTFDNTA